MDVESCEYLKKLHCITFKDIRCSQIFKSWFILQSTHISKSENILIWAWCIAEILITISKHWNPVLYGKQPVPHLPLAPSPPSAFACCSCRPSPAVRCRYHPSSRRRHPSAGRTCACIPLRRRRHLRRARRDVFRQGANFVKILHYGWI